MSDKRPPDKLDELLSAYIDDELEGDTASYVDAELAKNPDRRGDLEDYQFLKEISAELDVPMPSADRWATFDAAFDQSLGQLEAENPTHHEVPLIWSWRQSLTPLAAAAAFFLILTVIGQFSQSENENIALAYDRWSMSHDDYSKPIIKRTTARANGDLVAAILKSDESLTAAQKLDLTSHGISLKRGAANENLIRQYELLLKGKDPVLITPELASVLFEGAVRRVSRDIELYELQPRLKRFLSKTIAALLQLRTQALNKASRRSADRGLQYLLTAAYLLKIETSAQGKIAKQCLAEAARIEMAAGMRFSQILGYEDDYSAYASRSPYINDGPLQNYERCVRWLSRSPLILDPANPDATRAAMLIVTATAKAQEFGTWNEMEEGISLLFGPADDLSFLELRRAMQSQFGMHLKSVDHLGPNSVSQQIAKDLAQHGRFHNKGLISGRRESEHPSLRLLGGSRSADGLAASLLTGSTPTFDRPTAHILDLPVLLGHLDAARLLSQSDENGPQILQRADKVRTRLFKDGTISFIEQNRLHGSAALLDISATGRESRRLLSASLCVLDERSAMRPLNQSRPASKQALKTVAPIFVEPYPELFDRYVFAIRQLIKGLKTLQVSEKCAPALKDLTRIKGLIRTLAKGAKAQAEGLGQPDKELGLFLLDCLPAFRESASWTSRTLNEIEYPDGVEYSQRLTGGSDTLVRIVRFQQNGQAKVEIATGAVLTVREHYGAKRLTPRQSNDAERPLWMLDWSH
jgi:hypothetical protein